MASYDPSQPPLISETLLKKRRSLEDLAFKRSITVQTQQKKRRVVRGENIKVKRPEQLVTEFRTREGSLQKLQRKQRLEGRKVKGSVSKKDMQSTVGFVVRIHEGRHSSPEIKALLTKMGLNKKYDAAFAKLDKAGIAQLKPLEAYLAFGFVTKKSVDELVHRRAFIRQNGKPTPLTDNLAVENALGDKGLLCLNDLAHEIFTVGPHFDAATSILCPFHMSNPTGHFEKKVLKIHEEVESKAGFLGDRMEEFLNKLL